MYSLVVIIKFVGDVEIGLTASALLFYVEADVVRCQNKSLSSVTYIQPHKRTKTSSSGKMIMPIYIHDDAKLWVLVSIGV